MRSPFDINRKCMDADGSKILILSRNQGLIEARILTNIRGLKNMIVRISSASHNSQNALLCQTAASAASELLVAHGPVYTHNVGPHKLLIDRLLVRRGSDYHGSDT